MMLMVLQVCRGLSSDGKSSVEVAWAGLLSLFSPEALALHCREPHTSHSATCTYLPNNKIFDARPSKLQSKFSQGRMGSSPGTDHKGKHGLQGTQLLLPGKDFHLHNT